VRFTIGVLLILLLATPATAAAPPDVRKLQREIVALKKQVGQLQAQVTALGQMRGEIDGLEAAVAGKADASALESLATKSEIAGLATKAELAQYTSKAVYETVIARVDRSIANAFTNDQMLANYIQCYWSRDGAAFDSTWDVIGAMLGYDVFRSGLTSAGNGGRTDFGMCQGLGSYPQPLAR
jgi:hypothetical protein